MVTRLCCKCRIRNPVRADCRAGTSEVHDNVKVNVPGPCYEERSPQCPLPGEFVGVVPVYDECDARMVT
jgi:hypothetical protein